jgi:uncharacterized protein YdeI (BOF family)
VRKFRPVALFLTAALVAWIVPAIAMPGLAAGGPGPALQPPSQQEQPQANPQQQGNSQQQQQEPQKVFTGTMAGKAGQYSFQDDASKSTYGLDHQAELSKYSLSGKKVQIVGALDSGNQTIHITKIALVSPGAAPAH